MAVLQMPTIQPDPRKKTAQDIQAFIESFQRRLGRRPEESAIAAFDASQISPLAREGEIVTSPEFFQRQQTLAQQEAAPLFESIGLQESRLGRQAQLAQEDIGLQQELAKQQLDLSRKGSELSRTQLESDIADSIRNIKKSQAEQQSNFLNQQQKLGLRPSGLTVGGLDTLGTETGIALNRLEADRANRLAQLALQQASTESQLSSQQRQLGIRGASTQEELASGLAQLGLQRTQTQQDVLTRQQQLVDTARSEMAKALETNDQQTFDRAIKLADLAKGLTTDQSVDLGKFGTIKGIKATETTKPQFREIDLGNKVVLFDDVNQKVIAEYAKGKTPGSASDGSGLSESVMSTLLGNLTSQGQQQNQQFQSQLNEITKRYNLMLDKIFAEEPQPQNKEVFGPPAPAKPAPTVSLYGPQPSGVPAPIKKFFTTPASDKNKLTYKVK